MFHKIKALLEKKKLVVALVGGIATIAVIVAIAVSSSSVFSGMSAKEKYADVMKNGSATYVKSLVSKVKYFGDAFEFYEMLTGKNTLDEKNVFSNMNGAGVEISLGDEIKNSLSESLGLKKDNAKWIDTVDAEGNLFFEKGISELDAELKINDVGVTKISCIYDAPEKALFVSAPELLTKAFRFKAFSGDDNEALKEKIQTVDKSYAVIWNYILHDDLGEDIVNRYFDLALSQIDEATQKKETVEISSLSQKQNVLGTNIDSGTSKAIVNAVLTEFSNDSELHALIEKAAESYGYDGKKALGDILKKTNGYLESEDIEDVTIGDFQLDLFADDEGEFLGFTVRGEKVEFECRSAVSKNQRATRLKLLHPGGELEFSGCSTKSGNKLDGTYFLKYSGITVLEIGLTDFDAKEFEKGKVRGIVHVKPSRQLDAVFSNGNGLKKFCGFEFELRSLSEHDKDGVDVFAYKNGNEYFHMKITPVSGEVKTITVPSKGEFVDLSAKADVRLLFSNLKLQKFIDNLKKAGAPLSVTSTLETLHSLMQNML